MLQVLVRCYAELNDFLPPERQFKRFPVEMPRPMPVAALTQELHLPIADIDLILVDDVSVAPSFPLFNGDRVSLFPVFESFDISSVTRVRDHSLRDPRFVLDVHLGKLATYLRLLGFDALYRTDFRDDELIQVSMREGRALLSKDRLLLRHELLTRAYLVSADAPRDQLLDVLRRFDLAGEAKPFSRCLRCNALLDTLAPEDLPPLVGAATRQRFHEFTVCPRCGRAYWRGSHYARMTDFVEKIIRDAGGESLS